MTRAEHLTWAKGRALELLDAGDPQQALTSMLSDLGKHEELRDPARSSGSASPCLRPDDVRRWITGQPDPPRRPGPVRVLARA